nr:MAG TPA: hypothetical protein [Caudoviricetes sp.]
MSIISIIRFSFWIKSCFSVSQKSIWTPLNII